MVFVEFETVGISRAKPHVLKQQQAQWIQPAPPQGGGGAIALPNPWSAQKPSSGVDLTKVTIFCGQVTFLMRKLGNQNNTALNTMDCMKCNTSTFYKLSDIVQMSQTTISYINLRTETALVLQWTQTNLSFLTPCGQRGLCLKFCQNSYQKDHYMSHLSAVTKTTSKMIRKDSFTMFIVQ
jgi:hypothetical protein